MDMSNDESEAATGGCYEKGSHHYNLATAFAATVHLRP